VTRGSAVGEYLRERIAGGDFPSASWLVAEGDRILEEGVLGDAVVAPRRIPASPATLYDLASLTKPLAAAPLAVRLADGRRMRLEDPLARHLPGWDGTDVRSGIRLLDLLTHRSGLPPWIPLYVHAEDRAGRVAWLSNVPLAYPPGTSVAYSDPGFILLGYALERAAGEPLDRLFAREIARPLGVADLRYRPPASWRPRIAATEEGNARERVLAGPEGAGYNRWRTGMIWGEVHDGNAHSMGGVAGHAGLFGTARAVHRLARQFLPGGSGIVPDEALDLFGRSLTPGLAEERSVGFQMATTRGCSAGEALSRGSFGHTGFTGTSVWIDPDRRRIYVLLTNRVHPRYREIDMNGIRREFHRLAAHL
jgi:CubicO group peptidase (beta-lactamase class C family)